jgi:tetratricopeptide (TPR) repeat protein
LVVRATSGSDAAISVFREATAIATAAGLIDQLWRSQIETARSLLQLNRFDESYETAATALEVSMLPPRARGILLVIMAAVGAHAGKDQRECEARFREGLSILGDPIGGFSFGLTYASEWYAAQHAYELLPGLDKFRELAPPAYLQEGLRYAAHAQIMMGNLEEGLTLAREAATIAARHGDRFGESIARTFVTDVSLARSGDVSTFLSLADERRQWLNESLPAWSFAKWHPLWLSGDWADAVGSLEQERDHGLPLGKRFATAAMARILAYAPELHPAADEVLDEVQRTPLQEPQTAVHYTTGTWLMHTTEALATARRPWDWPRVCELAEQVLARGAVVDTAVGDLGLWRKTAGIACASAGRWDAAAGHFETALEQARSLPHRIEQAETARWYAWALLERGRSGDIDRARTLLDQAAEQYRTIPMPRHLEIALTLLQRCQPAQSAS